MSAALLAGGVDARADELHDILDCGPATLRALALRIEASAGDMELIYRETEIDEVWRWVDVGLGQAQHCLLYTSPSPRDKRQSRMPSSA